MRAVYYPFDLLIESETLSVTGDAAKHLQVVRIKPDEELLVLNGRGKQAKSKVISITKNQIELKVLDVLTNQPQHHISLAIGVPKKEAFEDILKMAVELGVVSIFPLTTDFSQYEFGESERIQRILESALIQSNNTYLPIIYPQQKIETFLENLHSPLYFFNSKASVSGKECGKAEKINEEKVILIGPEGGFSQREEDLISSKSQGFSIHLPTPILRAPTAVATSIGYLLSAAQFAPK